MTDNPPLLAARGLGRREPNTEEWLLRDVSVEIRAGSRLAIVGPTGSGKTLLLRALAWLDPISTGLIRWKGKPVSGHEVPHYRRHIIYLHQRPALAERTVEENLRLPFELHEHHARNFPRDTILTYLDQANLDKTILDRSTRELSGGEAQIVALLRAIQLEPDVLLLDEPTAALDSQSASRIEQLVARWFDHSSADRAFIWVSHNSEQVARVADRVMTMTDGRLSDEQNTQDLEPSP
jgi:putative ABC transport system ATP-binding protein